jgi:hypothetical protein
MPRLLGLLVLLLTLSSIAASIRSYGSRSRFRVGQGRAATPAQQPVVPDGASRRDAAPAPESLRDLSLVESVQRVQLAIRDCLVDADFVDANPRDVAAFLTTCSGVPVLIDEAAREAVDSDVPVTVAWRRIPLRDAVNALATVYSLEWNITDEAVVLLFARRCSLSKPALDRFADLSHPSTRDWEQILGVGGDGVEGKAKSIRITVELENATFASVVDYIREISGIPFCIHSTNIEDVGPSVGISLRDTIISSALDEICEKCGYEWWIDADLIQVARKGRRPPKVEYANAETTRIDVVAEGATPSEMIDLLRAAGIRCDVHGDLPTRTARVDLRGVLVRSAMDWICAEFGVTYEMTTVGVAVHAPAEP